jgi:hypothetical protein
MYQLSSYLSNIYLSLFSIIATMRQDKPQAGIAAIIGACSPEALKAANMQDYRLPVPT